MSGHKRAVLDLSFSKYAKLLASSSTDKTIKIWNLNDFSCINTFDGHLGSVLKIGWVYFGTHLASSAADGLIKLWNLKTSECINTINAHEGKIWALDVSTDNQSETCQILTGGTDSKIIIWNDVSAQKETEILKTSSDKILKREKLISLNRDKEYYEGMSLALELNHRNNFLNILKSYFDDIYKQNNGQDEYQDNISIIINNRKKLEEEDGNSSINVKECLSKTLKTVINDTELKRIIKSNINLILEITRDNSIKSSNFLYVQILLKFILVSTRHEFFEQSVNIGKKNKKLSKQRKDIDFIENFRIIKSYSEKHLERINREIIKAYLVDFVLEKMKII
jgi:U3 small nucleolar RNA-associated protein 13